MTGKPPGRLFISRRRPYHGVQSSTLSALFRETMERAGIDVSTYQPHSTRSAVVAKKSSAGASVKQLLKLGRWRTKSVFKKHYQKAVLLSDDSSSEEEVSSDSEFS